MQIIVTSLLSTFLRLPHPTKNRCPQKTSKHRVVGLPAECYQMRFQLSAEAILFQIRKKSRDFSASSVGDASIIRIHLHFSTPGTPIASQMLVNYF